MSPKDTNPKAKWSFKPEEKKEEAKAAPAPAPKLPYKDKYEVSTALMKAGRGNPEVLTQLEDHFDMKYDGKDWDGFCSKVREKAKKLL